MNYLLEIKYLSKNHFFFFFILVINCSCEDLLRIISFPEIFKHVIQFRKI